MTRSALVLLAVLGLSACTATQQTVAVVPPSTPPAEPPPVPVVLPDPTPTPAAPAADPRLDTVRAGRFDGGKMWTFDAPPADFFRQTYGVDASDAWFQKARLGALRFATYCSASLVSPAGLVMTNHHCARESVEAVSRSGENLLRDGYFARRTADERRAPELFVDQLVGIRDVTDEATRGLSAPTPEQRAAALDQRVRDLETRLDAEAKRRDPDAVVQVVRLYSGARLSAYTFKRYKDVRLVAVPEIDLGFFGGDPDNFTFPRYTLDYAFFRIYTAANEPLRTTDHYRWNAAGASDGDAVFVVGNPGSTNRLASVAELEYERDVTLPQQVEALRRRLAAYRAYVGTDRARQADATLRNAAFDVSNAEKSMAGQLEGLRDPVLMARKRDAERRLVEGIEGRTELAPYRTALRELAETQTARRALAAQNEALTFYATPYDSPLLTRAFYGFYLDLARRGGAGGEQLASIRKEALGLKVLPAALERELVRLRLEDVQRALGASHPVVQRLLGARTPAEVAADLVARTTLNDSTRYRQMLDGRGFGASGDVLVDVTQALGGLFLATLQQNEGFDGVESRARADLNRARFALYGNAVPPDASFSLRIADGRVAGYPYNGTFAAPFTTFYGMYDRAKANAGHPDFALPARWSTPPAGLDLSTRLNLVSTNDITGGNSGSPLLDRDLRVVGLVFDSNVEGLPNEFVFRDARGRTVAVDARAILHTLDTVYDMDRLVLELTRGTFVRTEEEADRAR